MGPSEQTRGGLIISLVFDVAFLIKTFFFFLHIDKIVVNFAFIFP